ncbi:hypothetical protein HU200_006397 [Digitaria exilis]|uniref:RNase H type-1 domain-containing protein n=1 Tax=Digitaria exilis TaxID=1010633 RepID=A0A835FQP4_9POAL|nr:hypothetical protein HU200_006397 [Digitaria exilis]
MLGPPVEGWVKINSDGSFDATNGHGASAAVLRDHQGQVLAAQSRWYGPTLEVLVAETRAAQDDLLLALQLGVTRRSFICFEVHFIRREANSLADICAKEVSVDSPVKNWHNCFPLWLMEAAANDCNLHCVN